ncbi:hypothetical protein L484_022358 [Morus notabilis]|uniref:Uncharacterized protein n=1 Tax=Morus notabilis TaxID=981085 RepID=W9QRM9_9ROSA|nr:hypothetical protein L484_022358 [Morus notabilis]
MASQRVCLCVQLSFLSKASTSSLVKLSTLAKLARRQPLLCRLGLVANLSTYAGYATDLICDLPC